MQTDEIDIRLYDVDSARRSLGVVFNLIEKRRAELDDQADEAGVPRAGVRYTGAALIVHLFNVSDDTIAPNLLADAEARECIEHIARHGGRCGVVAKLYGTREQVTQACASSRAVLAALLDGRTLQIVEPTSGVERPPVVMAVPPRSGTAGYLASLVRNGDGFEAGDYLAGMIQGCAAVGAEAIAMAYLGAELRRAADAVDPDGGMIPCPLCLNGPRFRLDEIETHLVRTHAVLAAGAQR